MNELFKYFDSIPGLVKARFTYTRLCEVGLEKQARAFRMIIILKFMAGELEEIEQMSQEMDNLVYQYKCEVSGELN